MTPFTSAGSIPDWQDFKQLPTSQIAERVQASTLGSALVAIDGTQRWFLFDHLGGKRDAISSAHYWSTYMQVTSLQYTVLLRMIFEHGVTTVFEPLYLSRPPGEFERALINLPRIVSDQAFVDLYHDLDVQVHFYGSWQPLLTRLGHTYLWERLRALEEDTASHQQRRLYWGLHTPETNPETEVIGHAISVGTRSTQELIESYYGQDVPPVSLAVLHAEQPWPATYLPPFVGQRAIFYFTANSPLGMSVQQWRDILYDYLYCRRTDAEFRNYTQLDASTWAGLKQFYNLNRESTLGVGRRHPQGEFWYPLPQIELPERWCDNDQPG
jgi:hypothetical protein